MPDVLDLLPDEVLNNLPERALEPLGELVDGGVGVEGNPVYQACVEAFRYTPGYIPQNTIVVSLGTGQYLGSKGRPRTGYGWLSWLVGELLRSSNEQQTYATYDLLPTGTPFYRLDVVLDRDIDMDAADQVQVLEEYGTEFARKVDWERILNGADTRYLVRPDRRYPFQYAQPVH